MSCSLTCLKRSRCTLTAPLSTGGAAAVRSLWQKCWQDDRSVALVRQLSNMLLTLATCPVPVAAQYRRCVVLLTAQRKLKQREAHALEHQVVRPVAGILGRCGRGRRALCKLVKGGGVLCSVSSAAVHTVSVHERRGECVRVVVWSGLVWFGLVWSSVKRQASAAAVSQSQSLIIALPAVNGISKCTRSLAFTDTLVGRTQLVSITCLSSCLRWMHPLPSCRIMSKHHYGSYNITFPFQHHTRNLSFMITHFETPCPFFKASPKLYGTPCAVGQRHVRENTSFPGRPQFAVRVQCSST